jgi:hypothetical protein
LLAFSLTIAIFAFWSILGFSLVSALNGRTNLLRNALLSPVVGSAVNVLVALWVGIAGVPFNRAGLVVSSALLVLAIVSLAWLRPILPAKRLVPFAGTVLLGALLTGNPMFKFGFDWISFGNDDMANYTLASNFVSNYGLLDVPPAKRIIEDRDISAFLWYYIVGGGERPGLEIANGWMGSTAHLSSHQIYMPMMLALHLTLISVTGALLMQARKYRLVALLGCFWMACSSLNSLGTVYQLMGQVFGLALLVALCTLLCTPYKTVPQRANIRHVALCGILFAALLIVYPELLPFLLLAFAVCHGTYLLRGQEYWKVLVPSTLLIGLTSLVLTNIVIVGVISDTVHRLRHAVGGTPQANMLFPFYLLPSGPAHLWGFYAIGKELSGAVLGVAIVAGGVLLLATCAGALWLSWRGDGVGVMCTIMVVVGLRCFATNGDFALYKLAMYIQPFLLGTAILTWLRMSEMLRIRWPDFRPKSFAFVAPLTLVICVGLPAQAFYVRRSGGDSGGTFVEVPRASESHLISRLIDMSRQEHPKLIISDTTNVVLGKIQSMYMAPAPMFFISEDFVGRFVRGFRVSRSEQNPAGLKVLNVFYPKLEDRAQYICDERMKHYRDVEFDTLGALPSPEVFEVRTDTSDANLTQATLLQSSREQGILNRRSLPPVSKDNILRQVSLSQIHNQLLFVTSTFGLTYYTGASFRNTGRVSMFQPEGDYFFPGETMVSLGRDILLRVLNRSAKVRLVFEYTASLNGDRENRIPPASTIGRRRQFLPVEGRGSARIFSDVIDPQEIQGGSYVLVNMGTPGFQFPNPRSGIMKLFGRDILLDVRRLTGFGRDLSAVSDQEYEAIAPPERVQRFPSGLADKSLEYSGIYEDGWVAESSYMVLGQRTDRSRLVVRLMNPVLNGVPASSHLTLWLDGAEVGHKDLAGGDTEVKVPSVGIGKHRIRLIFDKAVSLPGQDGRPVSALLRSVGFGAD